MPLAHISERRLAANRANARKSPRHGTPEGKRKSSQNACKHNLYSRKHLWPDHCARVCEGRAVRYAAEYAADPVRQQLHYNFCLASAHLEYNYAIRDEFEAYHHSLYPGDRDLAIWKMLHQHGYLLALHRHESIHSRRMMAALEAIEQHEKLAANTENLKQQTHSAPRPLTNCAPRALPNPQNRNKRSHSAPRMSPPGSTALMSLQASAALERQNLNKQTHHQRPPSP